MQISWNRQIQFAGAVVNSGNGLTPPSRHIGRQGMTHCYSLGAIHWKKKKEHEYGDYLESIMNKQQQTLLAFDKPLIV